MRYAKTQRQSMSTAKVALYGLLSWAIPFAVSIPLMGDGGQPVVPIGVFKSIMVLVGAATGAWLLLRVLRQSLPFKHVGVIVGFTWFGINLGLDLLVLVPLSSMGLPEYFGDIGLRYLLIPILAVAIDVAAARANDDRDDTTEPDATL